MPHFYYILWIIKIITRRCQDYEYYETVLLKQFCNETFKYIKPCVYMFVLICSVCDVQRISCFMFDSDKSISVQEPSQLYRLLGEEARNDLSMVLGK